MVSEDEQGTDLLGRGLASLRREVMEVGHFDGWQAHSSGRSKRWTLMFLVGTHRTHHVVVVGP